VKPSWARVKNACSSASRTNAVFMDVAARQPITRRAKASITNATYTIPAHVGQYVKSATHNRLGAGAAKTRSTRSGARWAFSS